MINLRSRYDLVFVASPALLSSGAATALGRLADGVVVILEQGMSTATIANARRQLGFVPADALRVCHDRSRVVGQQWVSLVRHRRAQGCKN